MNDIRKKGRADTHRVGSLLNKREKQWEAGEKREKNLSGRGILMKQRGRENLIQNAVCLSQKAKKEETMRGNRKSKSFNGSKKRIRREKMGMKEALPRRGGAPRKVEGENVD